jgi:hypothetical protein
VGEVVGERVKRVGARGRRSVYLILEEEDSVCSGLDSLVKYCLVSVELQQRLTSTFSTTTKRPTESLLGVPPVSPICLRLHCMTCHGVGIQLRL